MVSSHADSFLILSLRLKPTRHQPHHLPPQQHALLVLLHCPCSCCSSAQDAFIPAFLLPWQTFPRSQPPSDAFLYGCTALIWWPLSCCVGAEFVCSFLSWGWAPSRQEPSLIHLCSTCGLALGLPEGCSEQKERGRGGLEEKDRRWSVFRTDLVWTKYLMSIMNTVAGSHWLPGDNYF